LTTLRSKRRNLLLTTALGVILIIVLSAGLYSMVSPLLLIGDPLFSSILIVLCVLVLAVDCILIYRGIEIWSYKIEFSDTSLATHVARLPFAQHFKCDYVDIIAVRKLAAGVIEIVPKKGKPLQIIPRAMEGGEALVFETLAQHIPAGRFEPGLRSNLMKLSPMQKIYTIFMAIFLVVLAAGEAAHLLPIPGGWTSFGPWSLSPERITGFTVESPDSVWIARDSYPSNELNVEHIGKGQAQSWQLPAKQLAEFDDLQDLILVNPQQEPVLVSRHSLYFLKSGAWQRQAYPQGYSSSAGLTSSSALSGEGWMVLNSFQLPSLLVHIRAGDPALQVVDLPAAAGQAGPWHVRTLADGTMLTQAANTIYVYRNGAWQ